MPRRCISCGKNDKSSANVSFFRFPEDNRRRLWQTILGLPEKIMKRKFLYVCSQHFSEEDGINSTEYRQLNPFAVPFYGIVLIIRKETNRKISAGSVDLRYIEELVK